MCTTHRLVTAPLGIALSVASASGRADATWILLHGSDGHETDLIPLANRLLPDAAQVALRGAVETAGGRAFFDRRADRTIDGEEVGARIGAVVEAIQHGQRLVGGIRHRILLGFLNGAIMAAALMAHHPELFTAAILIRPQAPFRSPWPHTPLAMPVLILDARHDTRRTRDDGLQVARWLRHAGATVEHTTLPVQHGITHDDERAIRAWLDKTVRKPFVPQHR
jgi:predicted esterase